MELIHSYVLSDCVQVEAGYNCLSTCESVWFKIDNATQAKSYAEKCDPIFLKKFGDVT